MNAKKVITGAMVVGVLTLGISAASAQGAGGGRSRPGDGIGDGTGGALLALVEEQTGLDAREIVQQLRDGSTLAQLIEANGGDVDAVIAAAVTAATEHINEAAEAGHITAEAAEALLAQVEQRVTDAVNGVYGPLMDRLWDQFRDRTNRGRGAHGRGARGQFSFPGVRADIIALAAEQTGLDVSSILSQLADGETLGAVLRANDVDVNAFVDAAVAQAEEQMGQRAQTRLDALRARLLDLLGVAEDV